MSEHPALVAAAEAVRRDLPPQYAAALDAAVGHRAWWVSQWDDGAAYVLGLLAQAAQEVVHVDDPGWPACSEVSCPAYLAHALFVEPDLGPDPFWTCHRTGLPVAEVGRLSG